jgi:hypothetical protein
MKMILSLLVFGILLSGCICPQTDTQIAGNGTQANGNGVNNGAGTTGGQNGNAGTGGTTGTTPNAGDIATYGAAVAAGVPLQCTVIQQGVTTNFFVKGGNMYMTGSANNENFEVVVKNDIVYMKMSDDMKQSFTAMGKSCDWLEFSDTGSGGSGSTSTVSPDDYTAPNVAWTCSPALFGDEKFAINGGICKMEDLYGAYGVK